MDFQLVGTLEFCLKKLLHEDNNLVSDFQINPSCYETHNLNRSKKNSIILIYYDILDLSLKKLHQNDIVMINVRASMTMLQMYGTL